MLPWLLENTSSFTSSIRFVHAAIHRMAGRDAARVSITCLDASAALSYTTMLCHRCTECRSHTTNRSLTVEKKSIERLSERNVRE